MSQFYTFLSGIIPAVVVFLTAWYILKTFFKQETQNRQLRLYEEKQKLSLPVRLQAYERIVLLLERISPGNLVMRVHKPGLSAKQFQQLLVQTIREEYDHNLSQQLYVSQEAWERVKNAKEEMIQQINVAAGKLEEKDDSTELSRHLLSMSIDKLATRKALDYLKTEARKFL